MTLYGARMKFGGKKGGFYDKCNEKPCYTFTMNILILFNVSNNNCFNK